MAQPAEPINEIKRILLPVRGGPFANLSLQLAVRLARASNAEITLLRVLSSDDDRFTNHSNDPNTLEEGGYESYAIRDIQAGEEITWNYRGWGECDFLQIGRED